MTLHKHIAAFAFGLSLLGAGCASEQKKPASGGAVSTAPDTKPTPPATPAPEEVKQLLANFQRVFFEFDSFELTAESQAALKDNAEILVKHPNVKVEVQGHADDRGTSEYNLSLGQKRAQSVRDYLVKLGVQEANVTTISYGEERPVDSSPSETAWSKNRRTEFKVTWGKETATGTVD